MGDSTEYRSVYTSIYTDSTSVLLESFNNHYDEQVKIFGMLIRAIMTLFHNSKDKFWYSVRMLKTAGFVKGTN